MDRTAFQVVGQITCAIPDGQMAVVIADVPSEGNAAREARAEVEALRDALPRGRAEIVAVHGRKHMARVVREKIEFDIAAHRPSK